MYLLLKTFYVYGKLMQCINRICYNFGNKTGNTVILFSHHTFIRAIQLDRVFRHIGNISATLFQVYMLLHFYSDSLSSKNSFSKDRSVQYIVTLILLLSLN